MRPGDVEAMKVRWKSLSPRQRQLLISHRPEPFEREWMLEQSIMTALENVYGPRVWDETLASVAEGDDDGERNRPREPEYAMTLDEIGEVIGVSKERVRVIINTALAKLRKSKCAPVLESLLDSSPWKSVRR